jgi:hypothetical protein
LARRGKFREFFFENKNPRKNRSTIPKKQVTKNPRNAERKRDREIAQSQAKSKAKSDAQWNHWLWLAPLVLVAVALAVYIIVKFALEGRGEQVCYLPTNFALNLGLRLLLIYLQTSY